MFLSLALCSPQSSATERALCEPATALDFNSPDWLIALLILLQNPWTVLITATNQKRPAIPPEQLQEIISHQGMLERFPDLCMFLPNKEEGSVTFEHLHTDMTRIHSFQMFLYFYFIKSI